MSTTFGVKIRTLREAKRYSLEKLGELTKSSKSYIWELENKNPPRPSAEKLSKIAEVLGVTVEYLLDADNAMSQETAEDKAFFRNYQKMPPPAKAALKAMVEKWTEASDRDDDA